jgi:plastocyanin
MIVRLIVYLVLGICIWLPVLALAQNVIVIKGHQFDPPRLTVPAGQKLQITVDNQDATEEEFESFDLDREQVVKGHKQITVFIGPLKPGKYEYWGDLHKKTTKGMIVAK